MTTPLIKAALITAYRDCARTNTTKYDAVPFDPPSSEPWARVKVSPVSITTASQGVGGLDLHQGLLQITVSDVPDLGDGRIGRALEAFRTAFPAGRQLTYGTQKVLIDGGDISPLFSADGWIRASISIRWRAYTTRQEV